MLLASVAFPPLSVFHCRGRIWVWAFLCRTSSSGNDLNPIAYAGERQLPLSLSALPAFATAGRVALYLSSGLLGYNRSDLFVGGSGFDDCCFMPFRGWYILGLKRFVTCKLCAPFLFCYRSRIRGRCQVRVDKFGTLGMIIYPKPFI